MNTSWDEVDKLIEELVIKIKISGFSPTTIVAIPRGGWVVAALIAQKLDVKKTLAVSIEREGENVEVYFAAPENIRGERVLLIEDTLESGKSIFAVEDKIIGKGVKVKTAAIFISPNSKKEPDFFLAVREIPSFPWDV